MAYLDTHREKNYDGIAKQALQWTPQGW